MEDTEDDDADLFAGDDSGGTGLFGDLVDLLGDGAAAPATSEEFSALLATEPEKISLSNKGVGDGGMSALSSALIATCSGGGGGSSVQQLDLEANDLGDASALALSDACAAGALPQLASLFAANNRIGSAGLAALAGALRDMAARDESVRTTRLLQLRAISRLS